MLRSVVGLELDVDDHLGQGEIPECLVHRRMLRSPQISRHNKRRTLDGAPLPVSQFPIVRLGKLAQAIAERVDIFGEVPRCWAAEKQMPLVVPDCTHRPSPPGNRLITIGWVVLVRDGGRLVDGIYQVTIDQGCIVIELVTTSLSMLCEESIQTPRR